MIIIFDLTFIIGLIYKSEKLQRFRWLTQVDVFSFLRNVGDSVEVLHSRCLFFCSA